MFQLPWYSNEELKSFTVPTKVPNRYTHII